MSRKKVLIVDDAPLMRMVIMNMLKGDPNLEVVGKAKNGAEALKMLPTHTPDLVLLDIEMPLMDGLTFLRHARAKFVGKILVLSAVTGLGSAKAVEATKLGADGIITKPSGNVSLDLEAKRGNELTRKIYEVLGLESPT
jgi:chemotaxis response regulator CheB